MSDDLAERMIEQRGGREEPAWTWLAQFDPGYMDAYNTLAQRAFGYHGDGSEDPCVLSPKVRELIGIGILAGQRDWERLPHHLRRVLELGATPREILDALQTSAAITGGPAMRMGIELLVPLLAEEDEAAQS
jgi:alkylhydroperoxidase/carboxymuconolactone decarboxylase family protein YurZ